MREDGKLLFGTNYGLIVIDPEKIQDNETFSPVVFTDLYVNGTQMNPQMEDSPLKQSLAYSDEIQWRRSTPSLVVVFQPIHIFRMSAIRIVESGEIYQE